MLSTLLSNVPSGTADALSYTMLLVVAIFLISGPTLTYYYWKKNRRMKAAAPTPSP